MRRRSEYKVSARKGHEVTVYCSSDTATRYSCYKGVSLINVLSPLEQVRGFSSSVLRLTHLTRCRGTFEVLHYYETDSSIFALAPRVLSRKVVISLDGLTWNRSSYPGWVRVRHSALHVGYLSIYPMQRLWIHLMSENGTAARSGRLLSIFHTERKFHREEPTRQCCKDMALKKIGTSYSWVDWLLRKASTI